MSTNNIDYQHSIPQSFQSKLIQMAMGLFGMKKKMEKKNDNKRFYKKTGKDP